jgi:divalent metal cation (Fe/Co/Zn/Cd) transporter
VTPDECANCVSCCCSPTHLSWRLGRIHQGLLVEYVSLGWMSVEVVGSIGIGFLSGSLALIAFGSDSLVEMISGLMVLLHLKSCRSSSDLGELTEKITKLLLVSLIPIIAAGAVYSYVTGLRPDSSPWGIGMAIGAVIIMPVLWVQKKRIGRETSCAPLSIDAVESVTCFFMALTLLGGLLLNYFLRLGWVDYVATAVILAFVAKESIEAFRE